MSDAQATSVEVLSAGAVEPGLIEAADAFERRTGCRVHLNWATTPTIRQRIGAGEVFDLLVVPADAAVDLTRAGKLADGAGLALGRVGVGVAVRAGAPMPEIGSVAAVERALFAAESVFFTLATSGIYVESMLKRQGWYERLLERIARFPTGPQMMEHLIRSSGRVFCMGAIVELKMFDGRGLQYVGPLPTQLQHYTAYQAAIMRGSANPSGARAFLDYLGGAEARAMLAECGVMF